jgi:hypothetical protein
LKLKSKLVAGTSSLVMAAGMIGMAAPAAHAVVTNAGTCENSVSLIKLTTPVKGVGLGDTLDNVKAAGGLAKDQTSHLIVNGGGTCSGVTPHGDKHIPFPPSGSNVVTGLTPKAQATSITGNASCAQGNDVPNDATVANAYALHGKITWTFNQTYNDLITALPKPYKMQAMVTVLGFNPTPPGDSIDVGGIVLSGVNAGAMVSGGVWFDPVLKTGGATGYNTGYELDLAAAAGCADDPASPTPPGAALNDANIGIVLSGTGATTPSLLGTVRNGLSFDFGEA